MPLATNRTDDRKRDCAQDVAFPPTLVTTWFLPLPFPASRKAAGLRIAFGTTDRAEHQFAIIRLSLTSAFIAYSRLTRDLECRPQLVIGILGWRLVMKKRIKRCWRYLIAHSHPGLRFAMHSWRAGPPILAPAFAWPKHVVLNDVMVLISGPMGKTFETTCLAENHLESLFKALDQACSVRRASCQFPRPVRSGLFAKSASKPSVGDRSKYSDDPSYRIRQNLQIRSERLRSMLRKVDRVLTG